MNAKELADKFNGRIGVALVERERQRLTRSWLRRCLGERRTGRQQPAQHRHEQHDTSHPHRLRNSGRRRTHRLHPLDEAGEQ